MIRRRFFILIKNSYPDGTFDVLLSSLHSNFPKELKEKRLELPYPLTGDVTLTGDLSIHCFVRDSVEFAKKYKEKTRIASFFTPYPNLKHGTKLLIEIYEL